MEEEGYVYVRLNGCIVLYFWPFKNKNRLFSFIFRKILQVRKRIIPNLYNIFNAKLWHREIQTTKTFCLVFNK